MSKKNGKSIKAQENLKKYTPSIKNKKAHFDYHLLEKLEAGLVLLGTEVKSLRQGKANLEEAYCRLRDGSLYLLGCNIATYVAALHTQPRTQYSVHKTHNPRLITAHNDPTTVQSPHKTL